MYHKTETVRLFIRGVNEINKVVYCLSLVEQSIEIYEL